MLPLAFAYVTLFIAVSTSSVDRQKFVTHDWSQLSCHFVVALAVCRYASAAADGPARLHTESSSLVERATFSSRCCC